MASFCLFSTVRFFARFFFSYPNSIWDTSPTRCPTMMTRYDTHSSNSHLDSAPKHETRPQNWLKFESQLHRKIVTSLVMRVYGYWVSVSRPGMNKHILNKQLTCSPIGRLRGRASEGCPFHDFNAMLCLEQGRVRSTFIACQRLNRADFLINMCALP
jgi:hypothetical protein